MNEERNELNNPSGSVRLAHTITEYQRAVEAMRIAEESLALSVSPFMEAAKDDKERLTKLSFVMPNAKVTRRIHERIYQLQDLQQNK